MRTFIVAHESNSGHPPCFKEEELKIIKAGDVRELLFRITGCIFYLDRKGMLAPAIWDEWDEMNGDGGPFYFFKELIIVDDEPILVRLWREKGVI